MLKAVAFDFDLTLADSTAAVVECTNRALVDLGFAAAEAEPVRRTIGLTLPHAFSALTGLSDPDRGVEFSRRFVERANEVMVDLTQVYPGVADTLGLLRRRGLKLAIVSTKYRHRIEAILEKSGLSNAVDVIVGAEDVREPKPHPEGLLFALSRLNVEAPETVFVGDHPFDAEVAARAGTAFVAVRTGTSPPEVWASWRPLGVIEHVGGLPALLAER